MKPLRRLPKARQRLPFSKSIAVRKFATVRFYSRIHARKNLRDATILTCCETETDGGIFLQTASCPFAREDGDAFCERPGWLGIETTSEFQRVTAQSFAAFSNQLLEL